MGSGAWSRAQFESYSNGMGRAVKADGTLAGEFTAQSLFASKKLDPVLDPYGVVRECCDSEEHPETVPVILALDVTGSMGGAAVAVAKKLNVVMTELYQNTKDVEFLIMGIGDLAYDKAPIQASQFESDIRIAEQLDKLYFEGGGGGNGFESYTAAWYFALNHTKLDCRKRSKKGLIITMGDEPLNPYLPKAQLNKALGDHNLTDIETGQLYKAVTKQFDVYHLAVIDPQSSGRYYHKQIKDSFGRYLDAAHLREVNLDTIAPEITQIVTQFAQFQPQPQMQGFWNLKRMIAW